jgi:hypothetical protein
LKVAVVSFAADKARDALLGVKAGEAGTTASASSSVLLENGEQFIRPALPIAFLFLIRNQIL